MKMTVFWSTVTIMLCLILPCAGYASSQNMEASQKALSFVTETGIISDNGEFTPEDTVTRADFAQFVSAIINTDDRESKTNWYTEFFSSKNDEIEKEPLEITNRFNDVPQGHWAYNEIAFVASLGLMNGVTRDEFAPERDITLQEAIKVIVDLLGYSVRAELIGEYPHSYITIASDLKLTSNIHISYDTVLRRADAAELIYNAVNTAMLKPVRFGSETYYQTEKNKTLLSEVMKMEKHTGVLSDNGITTFTGESRIGKNSIMVSGLVLRITDKTEYGREYIGRSVDVYYRQTDQTVAYITLTGRDDFVQFNIEDFVSYSTSSITYNSNGRVRDVRIAPGATLIYNGFAVKQYDGTYFEKSQGDVTLISNSDTNSAYDIIIVNSYKSWYVSAVDDENHVIYNKAEAADSPQEDIRLEIDPNDINVSIYMSDGKRAKFSDIKPGNVLDVAQNGNVVKMIISTTSVKDFKLEEISTINNEVLVRCGDDEYEITADYWMAIDRTDIKAGQIVTLYINSFGKVAWLAPQSASDDYLTAYLMKAATLSGIDSRVQIMVLSTSGEKKIYNIAKSVTIHDANGNQKKHQGDSTLKALSEYKGVIRFKVDDDGAVRLLEIPLEQSNSGEDDRIYRMFYTTEISNNYPYIPAIRSFGGQVYIDDNTVLFGVPSDPSKDDDYYVWKPSKLNVGKGYHFSAYATKKESPIAQYVTIHSDTITLKSDERDYIVVTKISQSIGKDGETLLKVTGLSGASSTPSEVTLFAEYKFSSEGTLRTAFDLAYDIPTKEPTHKVTEGDIIRYIEDPVTGYVNEVQIYFSASGINPAFPDGAKGHLTGTTGKYSSTQTNGNPYITNTSFVTQTGGDRFNSGSLRIICGWVYSRVGNFIKITTRDLSCSDYSNSDSEFIEETHSIDRYRSIAVTYNDQNVIAKPGSVSDIKTYKDVGSDCSRVLIFMVAGEPRNVFVLNGSKH